MEDKNLDMERDAEIAEEEPIASARQNRLLS
jgi:hypothetical protein